MWCKHSKSLVVYPEERVVDINGHQIHREWTESESRVFESHLQDGAGVAVTLGVLAAPAFQYSILSNEAKQAP